MRWTSFVIVLSILALSPSSNARPNVPEGDKGSDAVLIPSSVLESLQQRLLSLEQTQVQLLQRIDALEKQRVAELRTLLSMYENGTVEQAPAAQGEQVAAAQSDAGNDSATNGSEGGEEGEQEDAGPDATSIEDFIERARELIDEEEYARAHRLCNVLIDEDPSNFKAYFWRGYARVRLGLHDEAIEDFQLTITHTDQQNYIYTGMYNQACVYALAGNADKCIEYLIRSHEEGFQEILDQMSTDSDLDSIRKDPRYKEFERRLRYP